MLKDLSEFNDDFILSNPYKEFTYTIANNGSQIIFYNWTFFQILALSATSGVTIKLGGSGSSSTVIGAGIGYELPSNKVSDRVEIFNNSGGNITCTIGLAIGKINDQRFVGSGVTNVKLDVTGFNTVADVALSTTASSILATDTTRNEAIITNQGSVDIYLGDSNVSTSRKGVIVKAGGTAIITGQGEIYGLSSSGTPSVAIATTNY